MTPSACILVGGLGTRLRSLYANLPKALVPVCGRPFIEYIIDGLRRQGIRRIHLAAGYRAGQIREWGEQHHFPGVGVSVSTEPSPLGTAGGIKYALQFIGDCDRLLVLNGDSLLPNARVHDLEVVLAGASGFRAVVAAVEMSERGQYGTVEISSDQRITAFREKEDRTGGFVNGGIYLLDPAILDDISAGQPASIERDVFPILVDRGVLGGVKVPGPLLDMGTPDGLKRTERYLADLAGS